jgi:putative sterol carrier protein
MKSNIDAVREFFAELQEVVEKKYEEPSKPESEEGTPSESECYSISLFVIDDLEYQVIVRGKSGSGVVAQEEDSGKPPMRCGVTDVKSHGKERRQPHCTVKCSAETLVQLANGKVKNPVTLILMGNLTIAGERKSLFALFEPMKQAGEAVRARRKAALAEQEAQFTVSIVGHREAMEVGASPFHSTYIEYIIEVKFKDLDYSWQVYRRFSSFVHLKKLLLKVLPGEYTVENLGPTLSPASYMLLSKSERIAQRVSHLSAFLTCAISMFGQANRDLNIFTGYNGRHFHRVAHLMKMAAGIADVSDLDHYETAEMAAGSALEHAQTPIPYDPNGGKKWQLLVEEMKAATENNGSQKVPKFAHESTTGAESIWIASLRCIVSVAAAACTTAIAAVATMVHKRVSTWNILDEVAYINTIAVFILQGFLSADFRLLFDTSMWPVHSDSDGEFDAPTSTQLLEEDLRFQNDTAYLDCSDESNVGEAGNCPDRVEEGSRSNYFAEYLTVSACLMLLALSMTPVCRRVVMKSIVATIVLLSCTSSPFSMHIDKALEAIAKASTCWSLLAAVYRQSFNMLYMVFASAGSMSTCCIHSCVTSFQGVCIDALALLESHLVPVLTAAAGIFCFLLTLYYIVNRFGRTMRVYGVFAGLFGVYLGLYFSCMILRIPEKTQDSLYDAVDRWLAPLIREQIGILRSIFVKYAQYFGSRADLISPVWAKEFSKLHDACPASSEVYVTTQLEDAFGKGCIGKVFESFDMKPVASASIGQVHMAVLHSKYADAISDFPMGFEVYGRSIDPSQVPNDGQIESIDVMDHDEAKDTFVSNLPSVDWSTGVGRLGRSRDSFFDLHNASAETPDSMRYSSMNIRDLMSESDSTTHIDSGSKASVNGRGENSDATPRSNLSHGHSAGDSSPRNDMDHTLKAEVHDPSPVIEKNLEVVVKVQHENIDQIMKGDMIAAKRLAKFASRFFERWELLVKLLESWEVTTIEELDLRKEAKNLSEVGTLLMGARIQCAVPKPTPHLVTKSLMVMSRLNGFKVETH